MLNKQKWRCPSKHPVAPAIRCALAKRHTGPHGAVWQGCVWTWRDGAGIAVTLEHVREIAPPQNRWGTLTCLAMQGPSVRCFREEGHQGAHLGISPAGLLQFTASLGRTISWGVLDSRCPASEWCRDEMMFGA